MPRSVWSESRTPWSTITSLRTVTATDVWVFYESLPEGSRDTLTSTERGIAAICDWRQEVNADGFEGYFAYWGGNTAAEALSALPTCLGQEWADLLEQAMRLFGPSYPTEQSRRESLIEELDLYDAFDALDQRFYDLEGSSEADARLTAALADLA